MEFGTFPLPRAELWQAPGGTRLFSDWVDGVVRADDQHHVDVPEAVFDLVEFKDNAIRHLGLGSVETAPIKAIQSYRNKAMRGFKNLRSLTAMFGLFGKKNKNNTTPPQESAAQQPAAQEATGQQPTAQQPGAQHGHLKFQHDSDGNATLTAPNGELVYGIISPAPQDASNYSYAKEILPGVYRFLATVDSGFKPLSDADLPEGFSLDQPVLGDANFPGTDQPATNYTFWAVAFGATEHKSLETLKIASAGDVFFQVKSDFPFGATLAITFDLFLQITKIPDHGHGHVVSMPGGSTVLVHPVVPNQPADNIMQQMAQTRHELRQHPVNVSPLTFWVHDNHWDVLTAKDGVSLFLPESFPVQRNADGAPVTSRGDSGTRA